MNAGNDKKRRSSLFLSPSKVESKISPSNDYIIAVKHEQELWSETIKKLEAELKKVKSLQPKELPPDVHFLDGEQSNFIQSAPDYAAYLREVERFTKDIQFAVICKERRNRTAELQEVEMQYVITDCKDYVKNAINS